MSMEFSVQSLGIVHCSLIVSIRVLAAKLALEFPKERLAAAARAMVTTTRKTK